MESELDIFKTPKSTVAEAHPDNEEIVLTYREVLRELGIEGFHAENDPIAAEQFETTYEAFLSNQESIIGSGNHAIVFDTLTDGSKATLCAKGLWNPGLSVACRNKSPNILPLKYERLRGIQRYYDQIAAKRREYTSRGIEFVSQASPTDEAIITNIAHAVAQKSGLGHMVPHVDMIIEYKREDEGQANDKLKSTYLVAEQVTFLIMTKVHGANIEQIALSKEPHALLQRIDFPTFAKKIKDLLAALHEKGIYHNDISTRNIMVDTEGNPHLIDFGAGECVPQNHDKYAKNCEQAEQVLGILEKTIESPTEGRTWLEDKIKS